MILKKTHTHIRDKKQSYVYRLAVVQLVLWSCFFYAFSALVPLMAQQTGWPIDHFYYALTAGFLLWAVFSPLSGYGVDRGHGTLFMQGAIVVGAVLLGITALSQSPMVTYGCMVILGVVMAFALYEPSFALLMRKIPDPEQSSHAITKVTLIAGMATLLVYPTITVLEPVVGWRVVLGGMAVLVLATLVIYPRRALGHMPPTQTLDHGQPIETAPQQKIFTANVLVPCLVLGFCFGSAVLSHTMLIFQLPSYLTQADSKGAVLLFLLGPSQVLMRLFFPILRRYFTIETIAVAVFCLMGMAIGAIWITKGSYVWLGVSLVAQGLAWGSCTILRPTIARQYFDRAIIGKITGTIAMIFLIFMALAPAFGGFLSMALGFDKLFASMIILQAFSALLLLYFTRRFKQAV